MAKEREIERWITVHGKRVPIYKDGSMGGFMEGKQSSSNDKRKMKEDKLRKDGMSDEDIKRYLDNEEKADALERELNEEMSSTGEGKHSVNWRREQQDKIDKLRDENQELKYGKVSRTETADAETKRAAQAEVLKDYGIDRDAALEAIKARTGKSGEEAEKLMDNMDVAKIKKLAEEGAGKKKEDFVVDSPIKNDPDYDKKRIARETADENDAYDREHKEGKYANDKNMPARSQEQLGRYDKYKQGFYYDRAKEVNVNGHTYKVWSDQNYKGTFAEDENGNVLPISGSGYLSKELSQRKAIANKFGEDSFRSKSIKVGNKEVGVKNTMETRNQLKKEIDAYVKAHPNPTEAERKKVSKMRDRYNELMKEANPKSTRYDEKKIKKRLGGMYLD